MAWPTLDNSEALQENARHNARFSAVRLPLIIIVSGFLWQLNTPAVAIAWTAVMLVVEGFATYVRGRLIVGQLEFGLLHVLTLAVMSGLWACLGLLLWQSDTELGRIAATIGLLTTALYGALGGQKDLRPAAILMVPPLLTLFLLASWHAFTHWPVVAAFLSSLGTLAACASVLVCAWALNRSDTTLDRANRELAQLAERLADNTALLEETSAIARVGGWRLDLTTGKLTWTTQTRRIHEVDDAFQPTLESALGFYAPPSRPIIEKAVAAATQNGDGWDLELQIRTARGVDKWVRANGRATLVDGIPVTLHGVFADISERVTLEEGLRQAQRLESVGRLAGGVAHDFNNVLTAIGNSAQLLRSANQVDARHAQLVANILTAAERAAGLTRNLLTFSRQQPLAPRLTDLNVAITEVAGLLTALIPTDIQVTLDPSPGKIFALLDPAQLSSALINLALNANDAMSGGGVLRLSTGTKSNSGVITVSDSGRGIDPSIASRIFDPFFTTKRESGGTGLGLAMVHGFVTQSGGSISVDSTLGVGTTFTLSFPLVADQLETTPQKQNTAAPSVLAGARILLVDDDDLVRDALAMSLLDAGYCVVTAVDGPRALQVYGEGTGFDLVIADVVLTPAMSGPQLSEALRAKNASLKIVLVSGYTQDKLTDTGRLPPGVSFLQKPFSIETLAAHLAELSIVPNQSDFGF